MKQVATAGALVVALAGIVGGVAYASQPAEQVAPMVVVPEAEPVSTGTPTVAASPSAVPVVVAPKPVATTTAAKKTATPVKAAPAPVRKATPVSSKRTVVKKATTTTSRSLTVASDPAPADPTPVEPKPEASKPAYTVPRPPLPPGQTEAPNLPDDPAPAS